VFRFAVAGGGRVRGASASLIVGGVSVSIPRHAAAQPLPGGTNVWHRAIQRGVPGIPHGVPGIDG
jgi:hypothetical protein